MDNKFLPGSFGAHEALHTAAVTMDMVDRHLMQRPTIVGPPDRSALADTDHQALFNLYQGIGSEHLPAEPKEPL
jgi:hypothetical protein